jgi:hypothetical protein
MLNEISDILSDFRLFQQNLEQFQKFPLQHDTNVRNTFCVFIKIYHDLESYYLTFSIYKKLNQSKNPKEKVNLLGIDLDKPEISELSDEIKNEINYRLNLKRIKISKFFNVKPQELEFFLFEKFKTPNVKDDENLFEKCKKMEEKILELEKMFDFYRIQNSKENEEMIQSLCFNIKKTKMNIE